MEELPELLPLFVQPLNRLGIEYMLTGSAASMAYGEPRLTLDVDFVVELPRERIDDLAGAFPSETFYCPPVEVIGVETQRETRGHFNVIHMATGFKADFYPVGCDALHAWGMARRRKVEMGGQTVMLAPPEYVILRKLEYYREGGSEKHLRDIEGMLRVSESLVDKEVVRTWAGRLGLTDEWERVRRVCP